MVKKQALCVGINYTGQDESLDGSHRDATLMADFLQGLGYKVKLLLDDGVDDEDHIQPTRQNIREAIQWLVGGAQAGDTLFFHFSGHGDQIPNEDGTEDDGWDEVILPLDWRTDPDHLAHDDRLRYFESASGAILDDKLHDWLVKPLPKGCNLNALFDNCHSGTALDLPFTRRFDMPVLTEHERLCEEPESLNSPTGPGVTPADLPVPMQHRKRSLGNQGTQFTYSVVLPRSRTGKIMRSGSLILRGDSKDPDPGKAPSQGCNVFSWGACSDAQICQEENTNGVANGLMVEAFIGSLRENPCPTYRQLLHSLNDRMRKKCLHINNRRDRSASEAEVCQDPQFGSYMMPDMDALVII